MVKMQPKNPFKKKVNDMAFLWTTFDLIHSFSSTFTFIVRSNPIDLLSDLFVSVTFTPSLFPLFVREWSWYTKRWSCPAFLIVVSRKLWATTNLNIPKLRSNILKPWIHFTTRIVDAFDIFDSNCFPVFVATAKNKEKNYPQPFRPRLTTDKKYEKQH